MTSSDHPLWNNGAIVTQSQPSRVIYNAYWPIFRKHAHLLIAWGHEAIRPQILLSHEEDEESITGLLYEAIRQILRANRANWCSSYTIHNEAPMPGGSRKGKDRRKTDLFIEFVTAQGRPEYVFEAKPQNYAKTYQRTDYYIGSKGMERFLEGEYADYTATYPEVGMIAYVLSDSVEIWQDRLKKSTERRKTSLRLVFQEDIAVIDEFRFEWRSQHQRSSSSAVISIYHILLDCIS